MMVSIGSCQRMYTDTIAQRSKHIFTDNAVKDFSVVVVDAREIFPSHFNSSHHHQSHHLHIELGRRTNKKDAGDHANVPDPCLILPPAVAEWAFAALHHELLHTDLAHFDFDRAETRSELSDPSATAAPTFPPSLSL
jgi:hypothetical protein